MDAKGYMKFNKVIDELKKSCPECYIDVWTPEDFQSVADNPLTDDECIEIVARLEDSFDANNGVNWDTIRGAL